MTDHNAQLHPLGTPSPARLASNRPVVRPLAWFGAILLLVLAPSTMRADSLSTYLQCLTNFETYGESIWHTATYAGAPADAGYWGDGGSSGNGGIRGNGGVALAYAVLVKALPSDPRTATRMSRIRQALNYNAATHCSATNNCVDGHPWGWNSSTSTDWQTPEWSGSMGLACVLVQDQLPAATVQAVQRVIASEATHRAAIAPASGYEGDTKGEENGWDSNVLALGAAWLSTNASAGTWLTAAKSYLANTYTVANTNGDVLAPWITTVTLYPDFALENHGFYHPTYQMVAGMSAGDSYLMARLANPGVATQLQAFAEHNILNVWTNLSHLVMDSGELAYPSGLDWELHDYEQNSYITWLAAHFNDPLARWTDGQLASLARYRQLVNGDGSFVGPSGGGFFREAVEARRTAIAWLHWANADYPSGPSAAPGTAFEHLPDVGLIVQRNAFGFTGICYGPQTNGYTARIMAVIEPPAPSVPTNVYVTTPRLPGIIGLGAMGAPTAARLVSLTTNTSGFQAELQLTNGAYGTTEVYVNCTGETAALVEVPWPSTTVSGTSGSFCVGIENDPLIGGSQLIEWAANATTVTNRTGITLAITNPWVCVSGRYGLVAGPAGYFNYLAASAYNRAGAAQDTLQFMPTNSLAPRYAVWFPGKTAAQTATNATRVAWTVSGTNGTLSFPGLGGATAQIQAILPTAAPAYTPYALSVASYAASSAQTGYGPSNAFNGVLTDYWVSAYGPTNHAEWLQATFPRQVALSEFQVYPRTDNGGYGPKDIRLILNVTNAIPASGIPTSGSNVYQATMSATSTLDAKLTQPVYATNAVLVITSAYDRGSSTNPRNVQVDELIFFERAQPGTFGDWVVRNFTAAQILDVTSSGASGDPDGDGVPNLVEFAMGGNPLVADGTNATLRAVNVVNNTVNFLYHERPNLGDVQRQFLNSPNLMAWTNVTPSSLTTLATNLNGSLLRQATFPVATGPVFYRLGFHQ